MNQSATAARVVLDFLRERIREASESANAHPHRKVLARNKTGTDMFRIRIAAHNLHVAANTLRGGIACVILRRRTINSAWLPSFAEFDNLANTCGNHTDPLPSTGSA